MIDIFISNADIVRDATSMSRVVRKLFPKIDVVCGIPRGGNLPACIISTRLGIPCNTPDLLMSGKYWWTSSLVVPNNRNYLSTDYTVPFDFSNAHILLVDDTSFNKLGTLEKCKQSILAKFPKATVYNSSVYSMWDTKDSLDFYCKVVSRRHWFEKDFLIRKIAALVAVDMDGFLCYNPSEAITANDDLYLEFCKSAIPYMIPFYKIDAIITGRLEKYRKLTEEWLEANHVRYNYLFMQEGNRRVGTDHAKYKAEVIKTRMLGKEQDPFYIESRVHQAQEIRRYTGIQTFAVDTMQLFGATNVGYEYHPVFNNMQGFNNLEHPLPSNDVLLPKKESNIRRNWLFNQ